MIPPLMGFFSKFFVIYSAVEHGYTFLSFMCILVSVVSATYYLKIIKLVFTNTEDNYSLTKINNNLKVFNSKISVMVLSNLHSYLISVLSLILLLFILKPSLILSSTQLLSLTIFNI